MSEAMMAFFGSMDSSLYGELRYLSAYIQRTRTEIAALRPNAVSYTHLDVYKRQGYYNSPAPDGSRPGAYYINLRDTAALPKWSLPTLTAHEGIPGHHNQISLAQEAKGIPFIRSKMLWFGAYGEGWALYSETVADELGLYENDPAGRIGYLQSMAFRAARCVVDTLSLIHI